MIPNDSLPLLQLLAILGTLAFAGGGYFSLRTTNARLGAFLLLGVAFPGLALLLVCLVCGWFVQPSTL
jgi:hypothetical protein